MMKITKTKNNYNEKEHIRMKKYKIYYYYYYYYYFYKKKKKGRKIEKKILTIIRFRYKT